jgi:ribonuclease P protein component
MAPCSLTKRERLVSKKLIDELFGGDKRKALSAYPLRIVYLLREGVTVETPVQVLISVPKRHLKHAVDRNRVKRQIRECYRRQKQLLIDRVNAQGQTLAIALIWQANRLYPTHEVSACVEKLLKLLEKRCWG